MRSTYRSDVEEMSLLTGALSRVRTRTLPFTAWLFAVTLVIAWTPSLWGQSAEPETMSSEAEADDGAQVDAEMAQSAPSGSDQAEATDPESEAGEAADRTPRLNGPSSVQAQIRKDQETQQVVGPQTLKEGCKASTACPSEPT